MKSLLVICQGFPPFYGGAEHVAYYLAREAHRAGCRVSVLTSDIGGRLPARETLEGMDVIRVRTRKKEWSRHTLGELLYFMFAAQRALPELMAAGRPAHVLAHFGMPAGGIARALHRRWGVPYSVVLHGSDVPGYQAARFGAVYPLVRPWIRAVWQEAHRVIAVSTALRDLARQSWSAGRIDVIENGVDVETFHPQPAERATPPGGALRLIGVCQLIERKGLQDLIAAVAALDPAERARLTVDLYGTGPYEPALRARAAAAGLGETFAFRGLADHAKLPELLRQADLFVLPSHQEGLPLAVLEAMACGLPVLATRVGGIPGVLQDNRHGLLVPPGEPAALTQALRACLHAPDRLATWGREGARAAQDHAWPACWGRYAALLDAGQSL